MTLWLSVSLAATFFVNDTGDALTGSACMGSSPCTLRDAVDQANTTPGVDDILVPSGPIALGTPLVVNDPVRIVGSGPTDLFPSGRAFELHADTELLGLRLTGSGTVTSGDGGCILAHAPLVLDQVQLQSCQASGDGGALRAFDGLTARQVGFVGNEADRGGAVAASGGAIELSGVSVRENQALAVGGPGGGGMWLEGGATLAVDGSFFADNHADWGAAIATTADPPTFIVQSTFRDNGEQGQGSLPVWHPPTARGGALFARGAAVHLTDSTFAGNGAVAGGAVFVEDITGGRLYIDGSTFHHNFGHEGASVRVEGSEIWAFNSTWSSNGALRRVGSDTGVDADISYDPSDGVSDLWGVHLTAYDAPWGDPDDWFGAEGQGLADGGGGGGGGGGEGGDRCGRFFVGFGSPPTGFAPPLDVEHILAVDTCVGHGVTDAGPSPSVVHLALDPSFTATSSAGAGVDTVLGPNGGPTWTHALDAVALAANAVDCVVPTDQRGELRPMAPGQCDAGAFERVQSDDPQGPTVPDPEPTVVHPWWW